VIRYLSLEWLDALTAEVAASTELQTLAEQHTIGVTQVVTDGPEGSVSYHLQVGDGAAVFGAGAAYPEDVRMEQTWETATAVATGTLNAQEAFIKAYRALPTFRGESAFYTWLYRIGINTAKNYLTAQGRKGPATVDIDPEDAESASENELARDSSTPEQELMSRQVAETVNAAMEGLPEELRSAIMLREIEGMSYDEIAAIMNCPIGTVRSRIFRARETIAEQLRPLLGTHKDRRW